MSAITSIETFRPHLVPARDVREEPGPTQGDCMDERGVAPVTQMPELEGGQLPARSAVLGQPSLWLPDIDWPGLTLGEAVDFTVAHHMLKGELPKISIEDLATTFNYAIAHQYAKGDDANYKEKFREALQALLQHRGCTAVGKAAVVASELQDADPAAIAEGTRQFELGEPSDSQIILGRLGFGALAAALGGREPDQKQVRGALRDRIGPHVAKVIIIDHTDSRFDRAGADNGAYHVGVGARQKVVGTFIDATGVTGASQYRLFEEYLSTATQMRLYQTAQHLPVPPGTPDGKLAVLVNK